METQKVLSQLMAVKENENVKDLVVRNINTKDMSTWTRVSVTLDKSIKAYVVNEETGEYVIGTNNVIYVSTFSLIAAMRENPDLAFAGNHLIEHPMAIGVVFSGAKIDVILEKVTEGQEYKNPFSDNAAESIIEHDNYFAHIYNIRLSERGLKMIDKIADKMLGFE